jgi:hypothetical protein
LKSIRYYIGVEDGNSTVAQSATGGIPLHGAEPKWLTIRQDGESEENLLRLYLLNCLAVFARARSDGNEEKFIADLKSYQQKLRSVFPIE